MARALRRAGLTPIGLAAKEIGLDEVADAFEALRNPVDLNKVAVLRQQ